MPDNQDIWRNWAETATAKPAEWLQPESADEIAATIRRANEQGKTIRVAGNGHSFTNLVGTDSILISLDKWAGIIESDEKNHTAVVRSGTTIKDLGELLHEKGMTQENLGDIDVQSIAGAISTGTHGTGITFGNLATQVTELTFINALGETITCSPDQKPAVFKAAQVSLGSLGVITEMKLKCLPKYKLELKNIRGKFDECLSKLEEYKQNNRNFEFYYFPYTEVVQMKFSNTTDKEAKEGGIMQYFNDILLENGAFKLVSEISRLFPSKSIRMSKLCGALVGESERCAWGHRVYATSRLVKFTEMEYNIPAEHFEPCLREMKQKIEETKYALHFPIECRFVKGDDIWLSPAYRRDSAYIAIHMYKGMSHEQYFKDMEAIFKKYDGRPHWGKMHYRSAEDFEAMYPMWEQFQQIRHRMDPQGIFLNGHLREVMLG